MWDGEEERGIYSHLLNGCRNGAARSEVASPRCSPLPFPSSSSVPHRPSQIVALLRPRRLLQTLNHPPTSARAIHVVLYLCFIPSAPGHKHAQSCPRSTRHRRNSCTACAQPSVQCAHPRATLSTCGYIASTTRRALPGNACVLYIHRTSPAALRTLAVLLRRVRTRERDLTRGLCPPSVCQQRYPRSVRLCGLIPSFCDSEAPMIVPGAFKA